MNRLEKLTSIEKPEKGKGGIFSGIISVAQKTFGALKQSLGSSSATQNVLPRKSFNHGLFAATAAAAMALHGCNNMTNPDPNTTNLPAPETTAEVNTPPKTNVPGPIAEIAGPKQYRWTPGNTTHYNNMLHGKAAKSTHPLLAAIFDFADNVQFPLTEQELINLNSTDPSTALPVRLEIMKRLVNAAKHQREILNQKSPAIDFFYNMVNNAGEWDDFVKHQTAQLRLGSKFNGRLDQARKFLINITGVEEVKPISSTGIHDGWIFNGIDAKKPEDKNAKAEKEAKFAAAIAGLESAYPDCTSLVRTLEETLRSLTTNPLPNTKIVGGKQVKTTIGDAFFDRALEFAPPSSKSDGTRSTLISIKDRALNTNTNPIHIALALLNKHFTQEVAKEEPKQATEPVRIKPGPMPSVATLESLANSVLNQIPKFRRNEVQETPTPPKQPTPGLLDTNKPTGGSGTGGLLGPLGSLDDTAIRQLDGGLTAINTRSNQPLDPVFTNFAEAVHQQVIAAGWDNVPNPAPRRLSSIEQRLALMGLGRGAAHNKNYMRNAEPAKLTFADKLVKYAPKTAQALTVNRDAQSALADKARISQASTYADLMPNAAAKTTNHAAAEVAQYLAANAPNAKAHAPWTTLRDENSLPSFAFPG